jgi:uncharacterized repeat protein (TIGR03803 family)
LRNTLSSTRFDAILVIFVSVIAVHLPAQIVKDIYSLTGKNSAAIPAYGTLAQGRDGDLYGTADGQSGSNGALFSVSTNGRFRLLHAFAGTDGSMPAGGLTLGVGGSLYGTTTTGGSAGNGVLFRVTPSGSYTVLHNFAGGSDGAEPFGGPIQGLDGNFYGTTYGLTATTATSTIYKYVPRSGSFSTVYQFATAQGLNPIDSLIQATDGNLYGVTLEGGAHGCGTIFKLTVTGTLVWYYSFAGRSKGDGCTPTGSRLQASDGNLYGTTLCGGMSDDGVVFKVDHQNHAVTILHAFEGNTDGAVPSAGLAQGTDGMLYGITTDGGIENLGTLFEISTSGAYTMLHTFSSKGGNQPAGGLVQHTDGSFYGTTELGGKYGVGAIYALDMGLGPFVALVQQSGKIGGSVGMLSQGLTGTTSVAFNGPRR